MRICLVAHGFPPNECTGVEGYTSALAGALAAAGHAVEVFAPRQAHGLPNFSMRREERNGFGITWITTNVGPSNPEEMLNMPGVAVRFGDHLDREKPELIHFQHLIKLGLGLLEQAKSRHIPSLYTAHDYYSVCHRVTLMRPDLQRCEVLGDPAACARCDLSTAFLNQLNRLGDYQLGVLEDQLEPKDWHSLTAILAGDPQPAGFHRQDLDALTEQRTQLDERRREVYSSFDLILSPTEYLRERMIEGGLPAEKIEILTYGAETRDLTGLAAVKRHKGRPVRFGYLGGLAKQKGVHVLLEAFESLEGEATLAIWGASSDRLYVKQIKAQAERVGARWMGAFTRPQLRDALEQIDVVVVPSIWVENFPFVIREALAAGRPVIASDVGAIPESVRHGEDGLLFAPGNAQALTSAMQRCLNEEGLLEHLVAGIGPIKSIEEQVGELLPIYSRLLSSSKPPRTRDLPKSLRKWSERYAELSALPQRELFLHVLEQLSHMSRNLKGAGEKRLVTVVSAEALASDSKAQMLLRDLKRERVWLKTSFEDHQLADKALRERVTWREEELDSSKKEVQWLSQTIIQREEESHWLKETLQEKERELEWLRGTVGSRDEEIRWLRQSLEARQAELQAQHKELEAKHKELEAKHKELEAKHKESEWLREVVLEKQAASEKSQQASEELRRASEAQQRETEALHIQTQAELDASNEQFIQAIKHLQHQRQLLGIASERLDRLQNEMQAVSDLASRHFLIKRTEIGRRIVDWADSSDQAHLHQDQIKPEDTHRAED